MARKTVVFGMVAAMLLLGSVPSEAKPQQQRRCGLICQAQVLEYARQHHMETAPGAENPRYVAWVQEFGERYRVRAERVAKSIREVRVVFPEFVKNRTGQTEIQLTEEQLKRLAELEVLWTDARTKVRSGSANNFNAKLARLWFEETDKTVVGESRAKVRAAQRELRQAARKMLLASAK